MDTQPKHVYSRYNKNVAFDRTVSTEQIIEGIRDYNEVIARNNQSIMFSFQEVTQSPILKVTTTFINAQEITGCHFHDFYELVYVFSGTLLQYIDGNSTTGKRHCCQERQLCRASCSD